MNQDKLLISWLDNVMRRRRNVRILFFGRKRKLSCEASMPPCLCQIVAVPSCKFSSEVEPRPSSIRNCPYQGFETPIYY